jgi:hypothetical protein
MSGEALTPAPGSQMSQVLPRRSGFVWDMAAGSGLDLTVLRPGRPDTGSTERRTRRHASRGSNCQTDRLDNRRSLLARWSRGKQRPTPRLPTASAPAARSDSALMRPRWKGSAELILPDGTGRRLQERQRSQVLQALSVHRLEAVPKWRHNGAHVP